MSMLQMYPRLFTQPWMIHLVPTTLRVLVGVMMIYHGTPKVFEGTSGLSEALASRGWPLPWLLGVLTAYTEFAGGILLTVGFLTRPVAVAMAVLFFIITFVFHGGDPFGDKELPLLYFVLSVAIVLYGPGRVSVDQYVINRSAGSGPVERA
jgi:putative oxidoreductase